jgi:hypothetical protein
MRKIPAFLLAACLIAPAGVLVAQAGAVAKPSHATYALGKAKHCRAHFVKKTERHKVKGKMVRYIGCVYVAPKAATPTTVPGSTTGAPVSSMSTHTGTSRAAIDPSYTQDPANPLKVTFSYSASETDGNLPNGVLSLYWGPSTQSQTLACSINVGGATTGGQCTITFPAYGTEYVTTTYVSGTNSATQTDIEDIKNPNPVVTTTTTTTTLAPSTTTVLLVSSSTYSTGHRFVLTATVTDQNGATVTVTPSQLTYEIVQSPGQYQSVFLSSIAASDSSCIFTATDGGSSGISFGAGGGSACQFPGGGAYGPASGSYAIDAAYSGNGSIPGSKSSDVTISVP